ncbi:hypothetical protein OG196_14160 [Kitasatospora purpeofusca]|uniref:hypothetical protein n=1 Tax=Kitasatospora purpeofusca TaxID=67352 RepID=UPI002E161EBD|nr:hypothetical protein OG196_14160 [Kitasatospora purpeofusca]
MLPALTSRTVNGRTTLVLDYTSLLDPLIRTIATERTEDEQVDKDLDHIADLADIASGIEDVDDREPYAAELGFRVDQFLDALGHARHELATEPRPWAVGSARSLAAQLHGMADRIAEWADRLAAQPESEPAAA